MVRSNSLDFLHPVLSQHQRRRESSSAPVRQGDHIVVNRIAVLISYYLIYSPLSRSPPPTPQAFREGGEDGVVEGLAPWERRLPPPDGLGGRE